jgi:hypothetical protein
MGIPLRITTRRNVRGKTVKTISSVVPGPPFLFDIPYDRGLHHRVVLKEIRSLLQKPGRFSQRKAYVARPWHEAVLRDAPMLKGFFADEPQLREKLLRWCKRVLAEE